MNSQFILPVSIHSNRQQKVLIQTKCDSVCARATFTLPIQNFTFFEYVNFHLKHSIQSIFIDLLLNSIPKKCPSYRSYPKLVITLELFLLILPAGGAGTDLELHMCLGLISQIHAFNFFSSLGLLTRPFGQHRISTCLWKSRQCPSWSPICRRQLRGRYSTEPKLPYSMNCAPLLSQSLA